MANQLVWLITGCSSGFGEALVHSILAKGDKVIATARSRGASGIDRLASLKDAGAAVLELDVTASEDTLDAKAKEAWEIYGHVDVLVNNAGYIDAGIFEEISDEFLTNALKTNTFGAFNLTRSFLPFMRSRRSGTILFMSSVAPYYVNIMSSTYTGSKGLLEGVVPAMAAEVAHFNINVCMLIPGFFRTAVFNPTNLLYRYPKSLREYDEMREESGKFVASADGNQPGDPVKASRLIVDAVRGEGSCAGKTLPLRLPLGPDAFQIIRADCEEKLRICSEWEGIMSATNLE